MLAVMGAAKPVLAQTAASPSPDAILIAKQIIEIKGVDKLFEPLIRGVVEKVKNQYMQTNFMWAKDLNAVVRSAHQAIPRRGPLNCGRDRPHLCQPFYRGRAEADFGVLPDRRSVAEVVTEEPRALDQSMANAGDFGDKLSEEVIDKFRDEMRKRGHDLS